MTVESNLSLRMWVGYQEAAGMAEVLKGKARTQREMGRSCRPCFSRDMDGASAYLSGRWFRAAGLQARARLGALGSVFSSHHPGMGLSGALTLCLVFTTRGVPSEPTLSLKLRRAKIHF